MNVGFLSKTSYLNGYRNSNGNSMSSEINNSYESLQKEEKMSNLQQMRMMLRDLENNKKNKENQFSIYSKDGKMKEIWEMTKTYDKDKPKIKKRLNYNYKEVSNRILRAKNSLTAGQAMLLAKRKVIEIKRKMANNDGDSDELRLALTHATRMEMAARKKKHNIEQEEMVEAVRKRDERMEKLEDAASDIYGQIVQEKEDEISASEDEIFEAREEAYEQIHEELKEEQEEITEEMMAKLNEKIAKLGEEALRQMEEAMEMLEDMEILNPHMSEEELEKVKRRHRAAEERAILKADMDYLKDTIKHQLAQSSFGTGSGNTGSLDFGSGSVGASADFGTGSASVETASFAPAAAEVSIDVSA